ncbi:septation ring formation regulator EzrA [Pelagibacteraceae bacterium]|nr:septation ring formation regulator EzrA [Pelagibacteraceae bacterium]
MNFIQIFKTKKIFLLNLFLTFYVGINLIGGERGMISYFEKKNKDKVLNNEILILNYNLKDMENKNKMLSKKIDLDYVDTLYRSKFKFGLKDEILIILK